MRLATTKPRSSRGFTIIELMIVVTIAAILASMAITQFSNYQARAKRAEVRGILKSIYVAKNVAYGSHDSYVCNNSCFCDWETTMPSRYSFFCNDESSTFEHITPTGPGAHMGYSTSCLDIVDTPSGNDDAFTVTSTGNLDEDIGCDNWKIDQTGGIVHLRDDITAD